MQATTRREATEGIGFGLIAGIIFAMMEVAGAAMMGQHPLMPVRMFSSVVLGKDALSVSPLGTVVVVGLTAHLILSAIFGLIYGLVMARQTAETQTRWARQAGIGLLFGALLWLVNFQIIGRYLYPWFLTAPQLLQMLMHALFFGLPLALMFAGAERRAQHLERAHAQG